MPRTTEVVRGRVVVLLREEVRTGPRTDGFRRPADHSGSMTLQIISTAVILVGVVVTALIAIIPNLVDR